MKVSCKLSAIISYKHTWLKIKVFYISYWLFFFYNLCNFWLRLSKNGLNRIWLNRGFSVVRRCSLNIRSNNWSNSQIECCFVFKCCKIDRALVINDIFTHNSIWVWRTRFYVHIVFLNLIFIVRPFIFPWNIKLIRFIIDIKNHIFRNCFSPFSLYQFWSSTLNSINCVRLNVCCNHRT